VLTTTSDSPQRDLGQKIGSGLPQSGLLRPVAPRDYGVPPLFQRHPSGDLLAVLWLPRYWIQGLALAIIGSSRRLPESMASD
jgi:hypothetical protein